MRDYLLAHSKFFTNMAVLYIEDVPDERLAELPTGLTNHAAWLIGHLASTNDFFRTLTEPSFKRDEAWREKFGGGSKPTSDRAAYPSKSVIVDRFVDSSAVVRDKVAAMSDAALAAPVTEERIAGFFPTIGQFAVHVLLAEKAFHVGQLSTWRRAMGYTPLFEQPERMQTLAAH